MEREINEYESSVISLQEKGGRKAAVKKSRAYLKSLQAPRGKGRSVIKFGNISNTAALIPVLERLNSASIQCKSCNN